MLTSSRFGHRSIKYYNDTADQAKSSAIKHKSSGGGLAEYYSEGETRVPSWLTVGDKQFIAAATGLSGSALDGGNADTDHARTWLDDGQFPNGASGREFTDKSVHGFDLTFSAPKSVSLIRALTDDIAEKILATAHTQAVYAAMEYLHRHAGYTRVHNPVTGNKDLQRLPGLLAIAYQHETSRCGDPHLHTHVIVPNRQARADGRLVSLDSKSLYHEAKAGGIIYQATLRHLLHAERGFEFNPVDPHTGMAEIAGVDPDCIKAWSRRSTRLREWARNNLTVVDGAPSAAQLAAAQKATRPAKPESMSWAQLKTQWRADARGLRLDRDAHVAARIADIAAHIDQATFIELIGAHLPVDAIGEPRAVVEQLVDTVGIRISAPREAHHREGSERFTLEAIIAEEERILAMADESDNRSRLDVRAEDVGDLSADQQRAIRSIAVSPFLVQPLQAPAGAGKTHSLKALRAAAHRARKDVLVLAPTGKAVDEAMADGAGDHGLTVAKALHLIETNSVEITRSTLVIVDEASMVGTPDLDKLLTRAVAGRAKIVLVGDAYQLSPVKARGGMFEQLCADLPWSQRLGEVWRMANREERDASLALRAARGNRLRTAIKWYRDHGRLHDALASAGPTVTAARDQPISVGDIHHEPQQRHHHPRLPQPR